MQGLNTISISVTLSENPRELTYRDYASKAVAKAVNNDAVNYGGEWHRVNNWVTLSFFSNASSRAIMRLKKGDRIIVNGRLRVKRKELPDKTIFYTTEVHVHTWVMAAPFKFFEKESFRAKGDF